MRLTADYHTHTVHSHGTGTVDDNVAAALARGLETVGIADHSVAHFTYGVRKRRIGTYLACIEEARRVYDGRIAVKAGIELNLTGLDGSVDKPQDAQFDVLILGYHKAALCRNLKTAWTFAMGRCVDRITEAYRLAIQRHGIHIVAHPGYGVPVDFAKLARACADYGALIELNNKHGDLRAEDIHEAAQEGARFVVSSDAHTPDDVGLAPAALQLVREAGLVPAQVVNIAEESWSL